MKTMFPFLLILAFASMMAFGQRPTIELTFTAVDNTSYVQLDSIKVMNRTQGGDTVLYYPDTVLTLYYVGIHDNEDIESNFRVMQNFPNPVVDQTIISIYVPEKDNVNIRVTDVLGRQFINQERLLEKGNHSFRFIPGDQEFYFFTATLQGASHSIKILHIGMGSERTCRLEYMGSEGMEVLLKIGTINRYFTFNPGDELLYIGYADTLESGILDELVENHIYTFQFATNIPCPGTPTVIYEGQVYNTIQIFSQCWLKENLNVGTMIPGVQAMEDDGIIEKYCYNDEEDICFIYGGLYQWNEMMQYSIRQSTKGICPPDWHIPTDNEWKILEGTVDSQYPVGDPEWDEEWWRGFDAGANLRETGTTHWFNPNWGATNESGFTALPGGYRNYVYSNFAAMGTYASFWTSSWPEYNPYFKWDRWLNYNSTDIERVTSQDGSGYSVRCVRDD
ncbi:MAG: hypothetical protein NT175_03490 [Bacteroidetes bacterium]|nr:hypothetical protein [Bacteroidota bacterium]